MSFHSLQAKIRSKWASRRKIWKARIIWWTKPISTHIWSSNKLWWPIINRHTIVFCQISNQEIQPKEVSMGRKVTQHFCKMEQLDLWVDKHNHQNKFCKRRPQWTSIILQMASGLIHIVISIMRCPTFNRHQQVRGFLQGVNKMVHQTIPNL